MLTDLENSMRLTFTGHERKKTSISVPGSKELHGFSLKLQSRKILELVLALGVGVVTWHVLPSDSIGEGGVHFLATLAVAVTLWILEVFDEYVVALALLLSWLILEIVPSEVALSGFSKSSWFFVFGALGMAAGVSKSGLLDRLALAVLHRIPRGYYKTFILVLSGLGVLTSPLLPTSKARVALIAPVSKSVSDAIGFAPRSHGSAGLSLAAYVGCGQMSFMFLTGATHCLTGWSLLPDPTKSEFGWIVWSLAALPAGILMLVLLFAGIHFLFPLTDDERVRVARKTLESGSTTLGKMTAVEWLSVAALALAVTGWLTVPLHGINEAWIALGALVIFLVSGVLDKKSLKNHIDWGFLLFFGVIYSIADICLRFKIDAFMMGIMAPILSSFSSHPSAFLMAVTVIVYLVRLFLKKESTVILLMLGLLPWAQELGIHPGVLLITILLASEGWLLPYQDNSYQVAYYSVDGRAFSHAQARKLMVVRFLSCFLVIAVSVPYWKLLGFIR